MSKPGKRPVKPIPHPTEEQEIQLDGDRWSGFRDSFGEREVGIDPSGTPIELLRLIREFSDVEAQLVERVGRLKTFERPHVARPINVEQDDQKRRPRLVLVSERIAGLRLSELLTRGIGRTIVPDIGAALFVMRRLFSAAESLGAATSVSHFVLAPERVVITPRAEVVIVEAALAGAVEALVTTSSWPKALRLANVDGDATQDGCRLDIARIARIGIAMMLGRALDPGETVDALSPVLSEINDVGAIRAGDAFAGAFGRWLEQAVTVDADVSFPSFREAGLALGRIEAPKDCAASRETLRKFLAELAIEEFSNPDMVALETDRIRTIRERQTAVRPLPPPKPWERLAKELGLPHKDEILQESPHVIAAKPKSLGHIAKQFGFVIKPEAPPAAGLVDARAQEPPASVEIPEPAASWQAPEPAATWEAPPEPIETPEPAPAWQETSAPIEIVHTSQTWQETHAPAEAAETSPSWEEQPGPAETPEPVSEWQARAEIGAEPVLIDMSAALDGMADESGAIDLTASVAEIAEESGVIDLSTTDVSAETVFQEPEQIVEPAASSHSVERALVYEPFTFDAIPSAPAVEEPAGGPSFSSGEAPSIYGSSQAESIGEPPPIVEPVAPLVEAEVPKIEVSKKKKKSWFRFGRRDAEEAPPAAVQAEPKSPSVPVVEPPVAAPEVFERAARVYAAPVGETPAFEAPKPAWTPPVVKPEPPAWTSPPVAKQERPPAAPAPPPWQESSAPIAKAMPEPVVEEEEEFEDEEPAETATPDERNTWIKSVATELGVKPPTDVAMSEPEAQNLASASWQAPTPPAMPAWHSPSPPGTPAASAWQAPPSPPVTPAASDTSWAPPRPTDPPEWQPQHSRPATPVDSSWAPPRPPEPVWEPPPSPPATAGKSWQAPPPAPSAPAPPAWAAPPPPPAQTWQTTPSPSAPAAPAWQAPAPSPPPSTWREPAAELPKSKPAKKAPPQLPQILGAASQLLRSAALLVLAAGLIGGLAWFGRSYYQQKTTPGTVVIESNPRGADVFIDGASKGVTPLTIELPAGEHELELRRRGGSRKLTLQVAAGEQLRQQIDLTNLRATGTIVVNSDPKGARVLLDGKALGVTPLTIPDVPTGAHKVSIEASSGTVTKDVQVAGGGTTNVNEGIFSGWIAVFAPFPLQVFERQKLIGTTDNERIMLSAGRHNLELVNTQLGFRESRPVDVKPGDTVAVNVTSAEGTLRITAPAGSEVFIDGARVGEAPLDEQKVAVGTREIVVKHPTLGEKKVTTRVGSDKTAEVTVTFDQP